MEALENILNITAEFDVKVETLAAALLAEVDGETADFGIDQVVVSAQGSQKRRIATDLLGIRKKYYDHDNAILLQVNRKGLFDTLPMEIFLRQDEEYKTAKERTKAIEKQIAEARKFFLPFEQAIYHPRIEAEQIEQKYTESFPDFINEIWGLNTYAKYIDDRQRFLLCYLLPNAYRIVGNWKLTGHCFEAILKRPVDLVFVPPKRLKNSLEKNLAFEMSLGEDSIIGEEFIDDMPALEVLVKGVTANDLEEFLPNGKNRIVLEQLLYNYLLPLDISVTTKIIVTEDALGFDLGTSTLGYDTKFN